MGHFWSEALGRPLVWDRDEVAWGGPPVPPKEAGNRQRFDVITAGGDQGLEVDRLVSLGATRVEVGDDGAVVLADPDGNEFCVRAT